jgi:hypothetical protein
MKRNNFATLATALATLSMLVPPVRAAAPSFSPTDVALRPGGVLVGQVVDQQGVAQARTAVSIRYNGQEVVRTTSDDQGVFAAKGLRGGQYQLVSVEGESVCRLWAADTAPPAARPAALVVTGNSLVRGQFGPIDSWKEWVKAHPYIVAGTVVSAIAIPLALADDDWDSGS